MGTVDVDATAQLSSAVASLQGMAVELEQSEADAAARAAFRAQWEELMRRAIALQGSMQRFALKLAATPPATSAASRRMAAGAVASGVLSAADAARVRALGKQLLSVSM